MLKAIHAQEDQVAAENKINSVCEKLEALKLKKVAEFLRIGIHETLSYFTFPMEHWRYLQTNTLLERVMKEIRRRTQVAGSFPDGNSALMVGRSKTKACCCNSIGNQKVHDYGKN